MRGTVPLDDPVVWPRRGRRPPLTMLTPASPDGNGWPEPAAKRPVTTGARALDRRLSSLRFPVGKFSVRDTGSYARVANSVLQNGTLEPLSVHVRKRPQRAAPAHRSRPAAAVFFPAVLRAGGILPPRQPDERAGALSLAAGLDGRPPGGGLQRRRAERRR